MIHGMSCGGWVWEDYRRFFEAKGYRCLTPTLRYHDVDPADEPDPRLGTTSLLDYAADLENLIRGLPEPPIVMGHSMGGLLAQILGARLSLPALVLLAPAAPRGIVPLKWSVIRSFRTAFLTWGFWRKPMRPTLPELAYSTLNLVPEDRREEAYSKIVHESGRAGCELGLWLLDRNRASEVDESKVSCPVLVIAGSEDHLTPTPVVRKVAKKYRHVATYKEFADHAHWIIGEPGWEEVAEFVAGWLEDTLRG